MNKRLFGFFLLSIAIVATRVTRSTIFFWPVVKIWIDNPTDQYLTVHIDDHPGFGVWPFSYEIFPYQVDVSEKHSIATNDGSYVPLTLPSKRDAVMINPTRSTYILWTEKYSTGANSYHDTFELWNNKQRIVGPYTYLDQLVIPIIWDVWPNQWLPNSVKNVWWKSDVTLNKLYRYADFLPAYYSYIKWE